MRHKCSWITLAAGLGVDYTSVQVAVHHPLDPAEPDLPPSPVLVVATSDAKLHFYTLSHLKRPPPEGSVRPPTLPRRVHIPADAPLVNVPASASREGRADLPAYLFAEVPRGVSAAVSDVGWLDTKSGNLKSPSRQLPPADQWRETAADSDDDEVGVGREHALVAGLESDSDETVSDERYVLSCSKLNCRIAQFCARSTDDSAGSEGHLCLYIYGSDKVLCYTDQSSQHVTGPTSRRKLESCNLEPTIMRSLTLQPAFTLMLKSASN